MLQARLQSYHPSSLISYSESYPASTQSIPKDGIGSRHHPYASFIVDANGKKIMPRIGYVFLCKQYMYKSSKKPLNMGSSGNPGSRSPIFHYNCLNPVSVRELPLPAPQLLSKQESGLEGGRKVYVDLTTFVGPDPELYMTEYAAIRIVFTL